MKGKINKIFATTALATALVVGSIMPTFASDSSLVSTSTSQSTKVNIGVTTSVSNVASISVTVPTVVTLAVVADSTDTNGTPDVYIGTADGTATEAGSTSLPFVNNSKDGSGQGIDVEISKATVTVSSESTWSLVNSGNESPTAHQMSIKLQDTEVVGSKDGVIKEGASEDVTLGITLTAPDDTDLTTGTGKTTNVSIEVDAYGENQNYSEETEANALTVAWVISTTADEE